jgi:hypothetical protein
VSFTDGQGVDRRSRLKRASGVRRGLRVRVAQPARFAQLLNGASAATLQSDQLHTQVATSVAAFRNGWDLALAIFGLHLVGLGGLLYRSADFPKFLGALVILAGTGYLADSFGRIFVPGYSFTISTFTFVGEALLIVWPFKLAIKGSRSPESRRTVAETPVGTSQALAS